MSTQARSGVAPSPINPLGVKKLETRNAPLMGPDCARSASLGGPQAMSGRARRSAAAILTGENDSICERGAGKANRKLPTGGMSGAEGPIFEIGHLRGNV